MGVFHSTVVVVPDDPSYPVGTDEWNAGHVDENGNPINVREILTADRTYYVRTDGDDDNTGLVNNAGGAFLTIQHAVDVVVQTLDVVDKQVLIQVGNGTYTEDVFLGPVVGNDSTLINPPTLRGDTTTPANVTISGGLICGWWKPAAWVVEGFTRVGPTDCYTSSYLLLGATVFAFSTGNDSSLTVGQYGSIQQSGGAWTITNANAATVYGNFFYGFQFGEFTIPGATIVAADPIIFGGSGGAFITLQTNAVVDDFGTHTFTNPGNVTGPLLVLTGGGTASFHPATVPGSTFGTVDGSSVYNGQFGGTSYTVANLPAAGIGTGARAFVTDSNATLAAGLGNVVAAGGANNVPVYSDGTNWRIG